MSLYKLIVDMGFVQLVGLQFLLLSLRGRDVAANLYGKECKDGKTIELIAPYLSDGPEFLISPKYPSYDRDSKCEVRIKSKDDDLPVHVQILEIAIGDPGRCDSDYLKIYDGANDKASLMGKYCFNKVSLRSSNEYLFIKFKIDDKNFHTGIFQLKYYTVDEDKPTSIKLSEGAIAGVCIGVFVFLFVLIELVLCNWVRIKKHCACCCCCNCLACSIPEPEVCPPPPITIAELPTAPDISREPFSDNLTNVGNPASSYMYFNKNNIDVTDNSYAPPSYEEVMGESSLNYVSVSTSPLPSTDPSAPSVNSTEPSWSPVNSTQPSAPPAYSAQPPVPFINPTQPSAPSMVDIQLR